MGALVEAGGVSLRGLLEGEGALRGYMECPWHQAERLLVNQLTSAKRLLRARLQAGQWIWGEKGVSLGLVLLAHFCYTLSKCEPLLEGFCL